MKKIVGLFLMMLIGSTSLFAQDGRRQINRGDQDARFEKIISEMTLSVEQAEALRLIEDNYETKLDAETQIWSDGEAERQAEMNKRKAVLDQLNKEKEDEIKDILTKEQFDQYKQNVKSLREEMPGNCTK